MILSHNVLNKRVVHLTMRCHDDDNFPWGGEPVLHDGNIVGMTTSASYSFLGNTPVCMAHVDIPDGVDDALKGDFMVKIAKRVYPVDVRLVSIKG